MKKLFSMLTALCVALTLVPGAAFAAAEGENAGRDIQGLDPVYAIRETPVVLAANTRTVWTESKGHCTVTGAGEYEDGESVTITWQADEGYRVSYVEVNYSMISDKDLYSGSYTIPRISGNYFFFVRTEAAPLGGVNKPFPGSCRVNLETNDEVHCLREWEDGYYYPGSPVTVAYKVEPGYHVVSITLNGEPYTGKWDNEAVAAGPGYLKVTVPKLAVDTEVYITIAKDEPPVPETHTVTAVIDENGTITGAGTYEAGTDATVTYSANEGYHISTVEVDGVDYAGRESVSFTSIDADHTVRVTTEKDKAPEPPAPETYTVTAVIDENGTITGAGAYEAGTDATVTYSANEGYHISTVEVDGADYAGRESVSFTSIDADHTVRVTTEKDKAPEPPAPETYTVTAVIDGNGTITGSGTYEAGTDATVTYSANEGYHISTVEVDGADYAGRESVSFTSIDADHTVRVTTEKDKAPEPPAPETHTVTAVIDGNGTITGAGTYEAGTDATVTYSANEGYHISTVEVDGVDYAGRESVSFTSIDADHTVRVTTEKNAPVVDPGDNNGGTTDPSDPGDNNGGTTDPSDPGDNNGGTTDPSDPGDNNGGTTDPSDPGDNNGGTTDPSNPGNNNGGTADPDDDDYNPSRPGRDPQPEEPEVSLPDHETPLFPGPDSGSEEVEITDEEPPLSGTPDVELEEDVVIEDDKTPLASDPFGGEEQTSGTDEIVILDGRTPMGNLPQTGTQGAAADSARLLGAIALAASVSLAGAALLLSRKKENGAS